MAKRVLRALSRGKRPAKTSCMYSSMKRSLSVLSPNVSTNSCSSTLTKMREEDVVSSSFMWMYSMQVHGNASVAMR